MCVEFNSVTKLAFAPPQPPPPNGIYLHHLNLKSEVYRRKTFVLWHVPIMDVNQLSAAGFFFTNTGDVDCCAICGVNVGKWNEGDDAFKDHQRWSPSYWFVKGLFVGNITAQPETSQQPNSSHNVCGHYMEYTPKISRPERCKYIFTFIYLFPPMYTYNSTLIFISFAPTSFIQQNTLQWDGSMYPYYSLYYARMRSFLHSLLYPIKNLTI